MRRYTPVTLPAEAARRHRRGSSDRRHRHRQRPRRRLLDHVTLGRGIFGAHLAPVALQLLGHHHRARGEDAGAHSVCATRIVTVSSGAIVSQALISGTMASWYQGCPWTGAACALLGGRWKPSTKAPPAAAVVARKSRRLTSLRDLRGLELRCHGRSSPHACSSAALWIACLDALVGAAAADVGHQRVDVAVGRLRLLLQQRHRRHDLPGLAVAALRHVVLDPGQLHRMRAVGRKPFDGGDGRLPAPPRPGSCTTGSPGRRSAPCRRRIARCRRRISCR